MRCKTLFLANKYFMQFAEKAQSSNLQRPWSVYSEGEPDHKKQYVTPCPLLLLAVIYHTNLHHAAGSAAHSRLHSLSAAHLQEAQNM